MAEIFQPPQIPPTFVGGRQPYAPPVRVTPSVDIPKPDADTDTNLRVVVQAWQADAWPYAFVGGNQPYANPIRLVQPGTSIDEPSNGGLSIINVIRDYQLPILPGKLNPALMGTTAVVQPPFSQDWLPGVLLSWQPPDPQPLQPRYGQIVSVDNPPSFDLASLNQIVGAWQPLDLSPQQLRNFYIQPPLVVTYVPPANTWLAGVVAGWQSADPQPQQKRITQIASVDDPPRITGIINDMLGSVFAWQPPDLLPAQRFPTQTISVDNPPFTSRQTRSEIMQTWQPEPWTYSYLGPAGGLQPYAPRLLNPFYTAVQVDNPPFSHQGRAPFIANVLLTWQSPDPQPLQKGPLPASVVGVRSDNPPFSHYGRLAITKDIVQSWQPEAWYPTPLGPVTGYQPFGQRQLNPSITAVRVDNPPPYTGILNDMYGAIQAWQIADPQPLQPRNLYIQQPVAVTYVPYTRPWMVSVINAWTMPDPAPMLPHNLSPGIPGQSVDNPPRYTGIVTDLLQIIQNWQPVDLPPAQRNATQIVSVDNPPRITGIIGDMLGSVFAWQPPDLLPTQRRATQIVSVDNPPPFRPFVPSYPLDAPFPLFPRPVAIPVRVDSPPPRQFAWFGTVVSAWQPVPPRIEPQRRLFPSGLAVRVDNPPFDMRARTTRDVVGMWQPYDQPPSIFAFYRHYSSAKFIPFTAARIIKHPQLRGTLTVTTLVGIDGQPGLRSTDSTPQLSGDP